MSNRNGNQIRTFQLVNNFKAGVKELLKLNHNMPISPRKKIFNNGEVIDLVSESTTGKNQIKLN